MKLSWIWHEKRFRHTDTGCGNLLVLRKCFVIITLYSPILELLAAVISHIFWNIIQWNFHEIIYVCLQLYVWSKFPQNKPKLGNFQKPSGSRHTWGEISTDLLLLWKYIRLQITQFSEISNPQKSVCGRISTFLMSVLR